MVILGIDPGSITTGYAFLDVDGTDFRVLQYGVVHAGASDALENRLLKIVTELETLIDKFHPQALAMEGVFFAKNAKSALVLGHIRGAILVACRRRGMTFDEYPPRLVKLAPRPRNRWRIWCSRGSASSRAISLSMLPMHLQSRLRMRRLRPSRLRSAASVRPRAKRRRPRYSNGKP